MPEISLGKINDLPETLEITEEELDELVKQAEYVSRIFHLPEDEEEFLAVCADSTSAHNLVALSYRLRDRDDHQGDYYVTVYVASTKYGDDYIEDASFHPDELMEFRILSTAVFSRLSFPKDVAQGVEDLLVEGLEAVAEQGWDAGTIDELEESIDSLIVNAECIEYLE